ncbi:MAG: hypothetical protein H8E53_11025 [Planctomycetes bacterium]|nr:hypothetical protein [Planctomycetota bacterium]
MSASCIERYHLNVAPLGVLLVVAVGLHSVASGQVVQDIQTSTVTSGTVLDVNATINARRNGVVMGIRASNSQVSLARGQSIARFARWGAHVENGMPMLAMFVADDDAPRIPRKIVIPNKDPAASGPSPGESVEKLAGTLKIGDAVKFNHTIFGEHTYGADIAPIKHPPTKGAAAPFVFIGSRLARAGKRTTMTVTANAGMIPCTFKVPEEIDLEGRSKPIAKVASALKNFRRGDLLELEYKTVDYKFILTGVKPAECMGQGVLRRISYAKLNGYKHMIATITMPKRTIKFVDPEAAIELNLKGVSDAAPDGPVQTALKTLKPEDFVIFKYRRQKGVYWLDAIYPASRPIAMKPAPVKSPAKESTAND